MSPTIHAVYLSSENVISVILIDMTQLGLVRVDMLVVGFFNEDVNGVDGV